MDTPNKGPLMPSFVFSLFLAVDAHVTSLPCGGGCKGKTNFVYPGKQLNLRKNGFRSLFYDKDSEMPS